MNYSVDLYELKLPETVRLRELEFCEPESSSTDELHGSRWPEELLFLEEVKCGRTSVFYGCLPLKYLPKGDAKGKIQKLFLSFMQQGENSLRVKVRRYSTTSPRIVNVRFRCIEKAEAAGWVERDCSEVLILKTRVVHG